MQSPINPYYSLNDNKRKEKKENIEKSDQNKSMETPNYISEKGY